MSSKRIFIAVGIIVIISVLVTMLYILSQKKETIPQGSAQSQESAVPAALPSKTESSNSQENVEKARKIFENTVRETISDETKEEGSRKVDFKDQKGNLISLSDFESALGVKINPKIKDYLNNGYQVFYCPGAGGKKEFGAYLEYDPEKIYRGFSYDVLDILKSWESTIFPDLHTVLYPDINFGKEDLSQKIEFRDGKYRYAEVNLPDGKNGFIQYKAIEGGIIIAATLLCLDNTYQYYEPVEPY